MGFKHTRQWLADALSEKANAWYGAYGAIDHCILLCSAKLFHVPAIMPQKRENARQFGFSHEGIRCGRGELRFFSFFESCTVDSSSRH